MNENFKNSKQNIDYESCLSYMKKTIIGSLVTMSSLVSLYTGLYIGYNHGKDMNAPVAIRQTEDSINVETKNKRYRFF